MPFHAPPAPDERAALAGFLAQQQGAFRAAAFGLTDAQAAATPTPSTLSVGGLVRHTTGVQRSWVNTIEAAPERYADPRPDAERYAAHAAEFAFGPTDSLAEALSGFDAVCADVQAVLAGTDLDRAVPVPEAPWFPKDIDSWSVRWCFFHLLEELARHAGHADIVREAVDGATTYELVGALDGVPETSWLRPWRPGGTATADR